jgi:SAM-dependent methyltransferase
MKPVDSSGIYRDGRHYDLENVDIRDDIPFYIQKIAEYGEPVLELACGTGRITIPIAERGVSVAGLDISEAMLAHARDKAARKNLEIEWIAADCRTFTIDRRFKLIFFPFNSFLHLHDLESIEACLGRVREHLADGGRFIIDIFNPSLNILTRDPSLRYPVGEYPDPDGRGAVVITESNVYDPATQINYIKWYFKIGQSPDETVEELNLRILYPQEFDALLKYNGFSIEAKYGDYARNPFASGSPKQIVVCTARS